MLKVVHNPCVGFGSFLQFDIDEGEREMPSEKYPWDGVSGVRPFRGFAASTVVGVY